MKSASILAITTLLYTLPALAQQAPAGNPNAPVTRAEFQQMVRDAILNDPEIIMEAVEKLRAKKEEESKKASVENFTKHKAELQADTVSPSMGSKNPDVTIIMFFDYHCGFCKKLLPTINQVLNDDKKVRIIFREFPILSEDSVSASRAALAINQIAHDKYYAFHTALMKSQAQFSEEMLLSTAEKVGVDRTKLNTEMDKNYSTQLLDQNRSLGEDLGIRGTPALFVGDKLLPGAVPYETLKRVIQETRTGKYTGTNSPS